MLAVVNLRPRPAATMSALAAALIGGVVACAAPSEAAPAGPGGPGDPFAACMTENGVPAPPQSGPGGPGAQPGSPPPQGGPIGQNGTPPAPAGVDQGVWDKGMQACASLAPAPPPQH